MSRQRASHAAALSEVTTKLQAALARVEALEASGTQSAIDQVQRAAYVPAGFR
jgi:hypothetical protein